MANSPETHHKEGAKPLLTFIPAGIPRAIAEVIIASVPGTLLQFMFVISAAGLNIWTTQGSSVDSTYALVYLPVICLLPLVVGAISTLMHERVQGAHTANIKGSTLTAALAGFVGTFIGAIVIIIAGLATKAKPLGGAMTTPVMIIGLPIVMIIVSTLLAALGAVIVVGVLNKMEK